MFKYLLIIIIVGLTIRADEPNIYDPDSLVVIALLDSNNFSHDYYDDVIWARTKETVNDTDWRIARLYLKAGTPESLPPTLPGKLHCLPKSIGDLQFTNRLQLSNHNLQSIPEDINKIPLFQVLDIRSNPLKDIHAEIAQCEMLYYLGLSHTHITSLPDEFLDLDSIRPCNIAVDTIKGDIYPRNVIDLCGLENFTLTERQKAWAEVSNYEEYKQKYCQETAVNEPEVVVKKPDPAGIQIAAVGYSIRLTLEREGPVSLSLFNSAGKRVARVIRRKMLEKGSHTIPFSKNISPGVYFLRGKFNGVGFSGKVLIEGGI